MPRVLATRMSVKVLCQLGRKDYECVKKFRRVKERVTRKGSCAASVTHLAGREKPAGAITNGQPIRANPAGSRMLLLDNVKFCRFHAEPASGPCDRIAMLSWQN